MGKKLNTKKASACAGCRLLIIRNTFRCSKPFSMFSDFNHVVSNMSYWVFGLAFVVLVYVKSVRLPEKHHPKNDHHTNTGILQQLSIFYVCYHHLVHCFLSSCLFYLWVQMSCSVWSLSLIQLHSMNIAKLAFTLQHITQHKFSMSIYLPS